MAEFDQPAVIAADLLSEIVQYVKESRPTKTSDDVTQGFVFSFQRPGDMISPRDFDGAWSPISGTPNPQELLNASTEDDDAAALAKKEIVGRALNASFNTAIRMDTQLVVTGDGTLTSYSGAGRELSSTYESLLDAMEALPLPERDPADVARIEKARAVLWDADGIETPAYERYVQNADDFAAAQAAYTMQSQRLLADPATADVAPLMLRPAKAAVDRAFKKFAGQDAEKIEAALATVESLGIPLEQGMIAKARERFAAWNLPLANVSDSMPYTFVLPSEWSNAQVRDIGWNTYEKTHHELRQRHSERGYSVSSGSWRGRAVNADGKVDVNIAGLYGLGGSHNSSSSSSSSSADQSSGTTEVDFSHAEQMRIKLEYGLCKIERPWLNAALFRMRNYYLRGEKAGCISDGTIPGQVGSEKPYLPMITTHFIAIRSVEIEVKTWGDTRTQLERAWASQDSANSQKDSDNAVRARGVFGKLFSIGGNAHRRTSSNRGTYTNESGRRFFDSYGAHFDGDILRIDGTQVVAWLSEIVPPSPPKSDPALADEGGTPTGQAGGQAPDGGTEPRGGEPGRPLPPLDGGLDLPDVPTFGDRPDTPARTGSS